MIVHILYYHVFIMYKAVHTLFSKSEIEDESCSGGFILTLQNCPTGPAVCLHAVFKFLKSRTAKDNFLWILYFLIKLYTSLHTRCCEEYFSTKNAQCAQCNLSNSYHPKV